MSDRTEAVLQRALEYRKSVSDRYRGRFQAHEEVATWDRQFMNESVRLHTQLANALQKIATAEEVAKKSGLFANNEYQLQSLTDSVDDDIRVAKRCIEEMHSADPLQAAVKDILQSRLFQATRRFKGMLQNRREQLQAAEEKRSGLAATRSLAVSSRFDPTFLQEDHSAQSLEIQEEKSHLIARTEGLERIEKQLAELSGVFQELGRLVHDHELALARIDLNTDEAQMHLDTASQEIRKYHEEVTSNKHLAVKVFLIFVVFFAFFVVFLLCDVEKY